MKQPQRNRVDANQAEIKAALISAGAAVVPMTGDASIGFDLLVAFRGGLYVMEVKDGDKSPSKRRLTENEIFRRDQLATQRVIYHVVENPAQALEVIGLGYYQTSGE